MTPKLVPPPLPSDAAPALRQVLLGAFVVGQLVYLIGYNGLEMLRESRGYMSSEASHVVERLAPGWPAGKGHLWDTTDQAFLNLRRWLQFTGQDQSWSLFAPGIFKDGWFPALELVWDNERGDAASATWPVALLASTDGVQAALAWTMLQAHPASLRPNDLPRVAPNLAALAGTQGLPIADLVSSQTKAAVVQVKTSELFLSDNEPLDYDHYFRLGNYRLRRYESALLPSLTFRPEEDDESRKKRWQSSLESHYRSYGEIMFAYVRWRYAEFQRQNPDRPPPSAVILIERGYHIRPPDEEGPIWDGPRPVPLGRWRPGVRWDTRVLPLERYSFVTEQYESTWR